MVWTDVTIIRSHLIMRGFVEDYTVWIHHGETVIVNDEDEEEYDDETREPERSRKFGKGDKSIEGDCVWC